MSQEQEIIDWARSFGAPRVTFDGKYIRWGKNKAKWLVAKRVQHAGKEYLAAFAGDWSKGEVLSFKPHNQSEMPIEAVRILELEEKSKSEDQAAISEVVQSQIRSLTPATGLEPYLVTKQIAPHGALADGETLVIPLHDTAGTIWSCQTISASGDKRFHKGAKKKGCFFNLGGDPTKGINIAEGFATAASIKQHLAPDGMAVSAMDAGNLRPVAEALRSAYPDAPITIWADNDESRVGEVKAKEAAAAVNGTVKLPPIVGDFNDMVVSGVKDVAVVTEKTPLTWVHFGSRGIPLGTIENFKVLLDYYNIHVGYDVIKKRPKIRGIDGNVNDLAMNNVAYGVIKSLAIENKLPIGNAVEMVKVIAHYNPINPVMQWVMSKPWDKVSRLQDMFNTIESPMDPDLKTILLGRWFIGAIAAAASPNGVSSHGVLTFQGVQGRGKTMWIKRLAPPELDVIRDGHTLAPENKDNVYEAISHWIVELGEIDRTFTKSDVAQLKSFLTKGKDIVRLPYEATADEFPRRTVFMGTVNQSEFLADSTGNRRFWCMPVTAIDYMHNVDMQQFWAEIYELYKDGWPFYLDSESLRRLNESNEAFEMANVEADVLSTYFDWEAPKAAWKPLTLSQIVAICSKDGVKVSARKVSQTLTDNFNVPQVRTMFARTRLMPPKKL